MIEEKETCIIEDSSEEKKNEQSQAQLQQTENLKPQGDPN